MLTCMRPGLYRLSILSILPIALLVATACSANHGGGERTVVRVTERDFRISSPKRVSAGDVRLSVLNRGPDAHELIIVRTQDSDLPLRPDGLTVDEEALERATIGVLEPGAPGSIRHLHVHLAPGQYELICNMSGHYLGGMRARLTVE